MISRHIFCLQVVLVALLWLTVFAFGISFANASDPKTESNASSRNMVIGPEDLLEITVFQMPQFDTTSRVLGDGTITMPLIGNVRLSGLTRQEAQEKITTALKEKFVKNPNVSVNIKEYKSKQVSILGAVRNPGAYYLLRDRTLLQLLSEAGGLEPDAGGKCFIFREGSSTIEIDLEDLMKQGKQELNVAVLPGDVVNIPRNEVIIVYVFGAVRNPGAVEISSSVAVTLVAAIAKAGGPTEDANTSKIRIKRIDDEGKEIVIKANLKDIIQGKSPDIPLEPEDVINVHESLL